MQYLGLKYDADWDNLRQFSSCVFPKDIYVPLAHICLYSHYFLHGDLSSSRFWSFSDSTFFKHFLAIMPTYIVLLFCKSAL